jgi:hypothetical protein
MSLGSGEMKYLPIITHPSLTVSGSIQQSFGIVRKGSQFTFSALTFVAAPSVSSDDEVETGTTTPPNNSLAASVASWPSSALYMASSNLSPTSSSESLSLPPSPTLCSQYKSQNQKPVALTIREMALRHVEHHTDLPAVSSYSETSTTEQMFGTIASVTK